MQTRIVLALLAFGALATLPARANSITITDISSAPDGPGSDWTYDLSFENSTLNNGDYVTINDFGPATLLSIGMPGWTFSQSLLGPNSLAALDSAAVLNVTLTWTGGNGITVSQNPGLLVDKLLVLYSPAPVPAIQIISSYTTIDQVTSGSVAGSNSRVIGSVLVPPDPVPVRDGGTTVALLALAVVGIEGLRRKLPN